MDIDEDSDDEDADNGNAAKSRFKMDITTQKHMAQNGANRGNGANGALTDTPWARPCSPRTGTLPRHWVQAAAPRREREGRAGRQ